MYIFLKEKRGVCTYNLQVRLHSEHDLLSLGDWDAPNCHLGQWVVLLAETIGHNTGERQRIPVTHRKQVMHTCRHFENSMENKSYNVDSADFGPFLSHQMNVSVVYIIHKYNIKNM